MSVERGIQRLAGAMSMRLVTGTTQAWRTVIAIWVFGILSTAAYVLLQSPLSGPDISIWRRGFAILTVGLSEMLIESDGVNNLSYLHFAAFMVPLWWWLLAWETNRHDLPWWLPVSRRRLFTLVLRGTLCRWAPIWVLTALVSAVLSAMTELSLAWIGALTLALLALPPTLVLWMLAKEPRGTWVSVLWPLSGMWGGMITGMGLPVWAMADRDGGAMPIIVAVLLVAVCTMASTWAFLTGRKRWERYEDGPAGNSGQSVSTGISQTTWVDTWPVTPRVLWRGWCLRWEHGIWLALVLPGYFMVIDEMERSGITVILFFSLFFCSQMSLQTLTVLMPQLHPLSKRSAACWALWGHVLLFAGLFAAVSGPSLMALGGVATVELAGLVSWPGRRRSMKRVAQCMIIGSFLAMVLSLSDNSWFTTAANHVATIWHDLSSGQAALFVILAIGLLALLDRRNRAAFLQMEPPVVRHR